MQYNHTHSCVCALTLSQASKYCLYDTHINADLHILTVRNH